METPPFSRRALLKAAALVPFAGGLPWLARSAAAAQGAAPTQSGAGAQAAPALGAGAAPQRVGRFAHLTDSHLQPERGAAEGLAACLAHVQSQQVKPDFILTGGDNVMDVFEQKEGRARELAKLFKATWAAHCSLPVEHTIGNHDIYGWNRKNSGTTGTESDWGKKFATELFGIPKTYRMFDRCGWRFIVLDSVQPKDDGYVAFCDPEQMAWLESTLKATPRTMPVCVVSHIPILSLTPITYGKPRALEKRGQDITIGASAQHTDCDTLHVMFKNHGRVKLCLSGHQHLLDRCEIDGVTYICDGAVSGSWWKGPLQDVREGYGLVDLYADGTFRHQYVPYGWQAKA